MKKILVTGSNGYLGACVFDILSQDHNNCVHKLAGRLEDIKPNSLNYNLIVHCAGAMRCKKGQHQKSNAEGTKNLISGLKGSTKIIYISSKSVYGVNVEGTFSEKSILQTSDEYGKTKYAGELEILKSGHPYIILRPSTLFGLGINNLGSTFPSQAMLRLFKGMNIKLYTPDTLHEYLYVKDLAKIILKLIEFDACWNQVFNVSGKQEAISTLLYRIEDYIKINTSSAACVLQTPAPTGIENQLYMDSSKLWGLLGEQMLTSTKDVIQHMGENIKNQSIDDRDGFFNQQD